MIQKYFKQKASIIILLGIFLFTSFLQSSAQAETSQFFGVRRSVATIIFCGLGGAVLGISTLSFYGDPQNHIGNITTGLALGIVGGTAYVTTRDTMPMDPATEFKMKNYNRAGLAPTLYTMNWTF